MSDSFLEVQHLTKYFLLNNDVISRLSGKTHTLKAVDDISFSIQQGETLGLVGESGCGKSTTARLVTRLVEPTSGAILLKGEDLLALPSSRMLEMRKTIQLVFQDPYSSLNPRKTVRSEEHTSELQSPYDLVCRLLPEKKKKSNNDPN